MVVISVSIKGKDIREFDEVVRKLNYTSRSDAVRDAIFKFVVQNKWSDSTGGRGHFFMALVYGEGKSAPVQDVCHMYKDIIRSTIHVHFDDKCVEQLTLSGDIAKIQEMIMKLHSLKDVRVCSCIL